MHRFMTLLERDEEGVALVVVAFSMFMLMAVATLAIDGGLVHTDRRQAQNVADNASLAAAWAICEGRDPTTAALTTAAANGFDNDGVSNTVNVTDLGDNRALVEITGSRDAQFGQAIGTETLEVAAEAIAACTSYRGADAIPFGSPPSGFDGGLQNENPCGLNSGNCGRLYSLRLDGYGDVGEDTRKNIAYGTDRLLMPWVKGNEYVNCSTTFRVECNVLPSNTGVSAGQLGDGFLERLSDIDGADRTFFYKGSEYNADLLEHVLGDDATATSLSTFVKPPAAWDEGIHGPWKGADLTNHYWIEGTIEKCDSPRLASIVIVTHDMDYDPASYKSGQPYPDPWPNGSQDMKVLGHYYIYIADPDSADDFIGSGNLKQASAKVLWMDPEAKCANGSPPGPSATNPPILEVSLDS